VRGAGGFGNVERALSPSEGKAGFDYVTGLKSSSSSSSPPNRFYYFGTGLKLGRAVVLGRPRLGRGGA
jgi:hypothetical protein